MKSLTLLLASTLFFTGCSNTETSLKDEVTIGKEKGPLALIDTSGNTIATAKTPQGMTFAGHEGKVVLLNFFATWCPPCKAEIPHLNALQTAHGDALSIISVALEEKSAEELKSFIEYYTINYTVTQGEPNFELAKEVGGVSTIPYMVLYDKNGHYATHYVGAVPEEMIDADIKKALGL
ncbi:MAG: TlpA family protein disulfide reductase [Campylobacterales bacterium]|nr:TlpA family protein disulfide reductase [Campylobacterales bacterium]